jgi:hypothetical protein
MVAEPEEHGDAGEGLASNRAGAEKLPDGLWVVVPLPQKTLDVTPLAKASLRGLYLIANDVPPSRQMHMELLRGTSPKRRGRPVGC